PRPSSSCRAPSPAGPPAPVPDRSARWRQASPASFFPYTTLFRSRDAIFTAENLPQAPLQPALRGQTVALARAVPAGRLLACYDLDRKSTRLNSSHVSISYAAFCLQKKTTDCAVSSPCACLTVSD